MKLIEGKDKYCAALYNYMKNSNHELFHEFICFGIGRGLSFTYENKPDSKKILPGSNAIIEAFCEQMNFDARRICLTNEDGNVVKRIKFFLENDRPIITLLAGDKDEKTETEFMGNTSESVKLLINITSEEQLELFDPLLNQSRIYTWEELKDRGKRIPYSNKKAPISFLINDRCQVTNMEDIVLKSTKRTSCFMLHPVKDNTGIYGLKNFLLDYEEAEGNTAQFFTQLSPFEKTSGLLRSYYADYLRFVASTYNMDKLYAAADSYLQLAELWKGLFEAEEDLNLLKDIYKLEVELCELFDRERIVTYG